MRVYLFSQRTKDISFHTKIILYFNFEMENIRGKQFDTFNVFVTTVLLQSSIFFSWKVL